MTYEVRDYTSNSYLYGAFTKYDDAINCVNELCDDELEENDFDIIMLLDDDDKQKLSDCFTKDIKLLLSNELRIIDTHVIEGYFPNDLFINLVVVDKLHCYMLLSYSVSITDTLDIVEFEQISYKYLS